MIRPPQFDSLSAHVARLGDLDFWRPQYDFIDEQTLSYFTVRLDQAPADADFALDYVKRHATTPELRQAVCDALVFKTDVLWAQADALHHAYVEPGLPPPGAFLPEG